MLITLIHFKSRNDVTFNLENLHEVKVKHSNKKSKLLKIV